MRSSLFICLALSLAGCGIGYQSTTIREGVIDGAKVRVLTVTPQTVIVANQSSYRPRDLPDAFSNTAGLYSTRTANTRLPSPINSPPLRPSPAQAQLPPPPPNSPYQLGVGDVLYLATRNQSNAAAVVPGFTNTEGKRQSYTIQDDGAITIPGVGRVNVAGKTIEAAESELFSQLLAQKMDSSFGLEIAEFNARRVAIGGAVNKPGIAPITLTPLTLDAALVQVGGISASDRSGALIRLYRDGALYQIPFNDFLTKPASQKIRLIDGDSVFVDTEYDLERAQAWFTEQITLNTAQMAVRQSEMALLTQEIALRRAELDEQRTNFASRTELDAVERDYVYLSGELDRPGRWPLPYSQHASVADALFAQGGVTRRTGNPRQIYVLRGSDDPREFGAMTAWHLDAGSPVGLMMATKMELRPDDIIFVAEQPVTRWNRVIDQISPSLIAIPIEAATGE